METRQLSAKKGVGVSAWLKGYWPWIPFLFMLLMASVWIRLKVMRSTYEVTQLESHLRTLEAKEHQIRLQMLELQGPQRLNTLNNAHFGFRAPTAVIRLERGKGCL